MLGGSERRAETHDALDSSPGDPPGDSVLTV